MSTTTRTAALATQFEAVNAEIIAAVSACSDEQWRQPTAEDGRTVGVVAHHVGEVNGAFAKIVETLAASGNYTPNVSMEEVHESNAKHARDNAGAGKAETLDLLRANGDAILRVLGSIDDSTLDQAAGVFGGHEMTVTQVLEWIVIGHTAEHLGTIRKTLD
jgi:uncharacterized damage-inducible protein DinB